MGEKYTPITATLCYLRKEGATLFLFRQGEGDIHNGCYVVPGGKNIPGAENAIAERGIDCITREFEEETGFKILNPKLRIIATFDNIGRDFGDNSQKPDYKVEIYEANEFTGNIKNEEGKFMPMWVEDDRVHELNMNPGDKKIWKILQQPGIYEVIVRFKGKEIIYFDAIRVD